MVLVPIGIISMVFMIAAVLVASGHCPDTESRQELLSRVTTAVSFLIFLVYPMVSQTIFQGLICNQFAEDEWWLAADLQVRDGLATSGVGDPCFCVALFPPLYFALSYVLGTLPSPSTDPLLGARGVARVLALRARLAAHPHRSARRHVLHALSRAPRAADNAEPRAQEVLVPRSELSAQGDPRASCFVHTTARISTIPR